MKRMLYKDTDWTGSVFGDTTVLHHVKGRRWMCVCKCGKERELDMCALNSGRGKLCLGCTLKNRTVKKLSVLVGKTFGSWTVIELGISKSGRNVLICQCECGNTSNVCPHHLINGNSVRCRSCARKITDEPAFNSLWSRYTSNAKKRGIEWKLSKEQFKEMTKQNCYFTGLPPSNIIRSQAGREYVYNGVDRFENSKGYTIENCVPCCSKANEMKMMSTYEETISMCYLMIKEHERKQAVENENKLKAI